MAKPKQYEGSSLEGLLKEMGDYEEITARALKRVLAEQLTDCMAANQSVDENP